MSLLFFGLIIGYRTLALSVTRSGEFLTLEKSVGADLARRMFHVKSLQPWESLPTSHIRAFQIVPPASESGRSDAAQGQETPREAPLEDDCPFAEARLFLM